MQENTAKAHWQHHVRGDQAKGQDAGGQPAVQAQLVHHFQQGGYQNRDEGDMNGHQILAHDRGCQQHGEQQGANAAKLARRRRAAKFFDNAPGQPFGDTGAGDGHGKSPQQGIAEGNVGTVA